MFFNTLSGRFLLLTAVFVMLAEVLIFVPSVARFRQDYLQERIDQAHLASLALMAAPDEMVTQNLADELLENADVLNIVIRRNERREMILSKPLTAQVMDTYDLRSDGPLELMKDALTCLFMPTEGVVRVIGRPVKGNGSELEVTLQLMPMRAAMLEYGLNILLLSLLISVISAGMLFFVVRRAVVRPIHRVIESMIAYQDNPEDATRVIQPNARIRELRVAESTLCELQTDLTASLKQKERLAQLGSAVAKVSHDLRNILTTTQLLTDRIEASEDPVVARVAPKLVASVGRAINLCEHTLTYGKAEEPAPRLSKFLLARLVDEVIESEDLRQNDDLVRMHSKVPQDLMLNADRDQIFRVLINLVRNARQAIVATGKPGSITIEAGKSESGVQITLTDTGPGLPQKAREKLFKPFQGSVRKGGTGLGMAIAAELVRGHGGKLELLESTAQGTTFQITLP